MLSPGIVQVKGRSEVDHAVCFMEVGIESDVTKLPGGK